MDFSILSNQGSQKLHAHLPVSVRNENTDFTVETKKFEKNGQRMVKFFTSFEKLITKNYFN